MAHDTSPITIYSPSGAPATVPAHQYQTVWFPRGWRKSPKAAIQAADTRKGDTNDDAPEGVEENH